MSAYNFNIKNKGSVSQAFIGKGIQTFEKACHFVTELPFKRNSDKTDKLIVFKEMKGTCGTKHALLNELCLEQEIEDVQLILVLLKMSGKNMPAVKKILTEHGLDHIPEAHNYLLVKGEKVDCTGGNFSVHQFENEILSEIAIESSQINDFKVSYHKSQLKEWLKNQANISISPNELWNIRETCVQAIAEQ